MKTTLITEYPLWFIIFCLLLGSMYAFLFYRRDNKFRDVNHWWIRGMAALRFLTVSILAFLLLSPLLRSLEQNIERPIIILAQDNSASIVINNDSAYYRNSYKSDLQKFVDQARQEYDLVAYSFSDNLEKSLPLDFSGQLTDFSALFDAIKSRYVNRNVGALIIASDGLYNKGINPLYAAPEGHFPIYTVALGDSSLQKDISITQLKANKIAFLGNKFPMQVQLAFKELTGTTANLTITHGGQVVFRKTITSDANPYYETIDIELETKQTGLQRYNVYTSTHPDEINTKNNARSVVIDVIDSKQKVLILANAPHPDVAALKRSLIRNPNYDVFTSDIASFKEAVDGYNLVVLHQLPAKNNAAAQILKRIMSEHIPVLFILGAESNIQQLNQLNIGLAINHQKNAYDESQAIVNDKFTLFENNEEFGTFIRKCPPLIVPFGDFAFSQEANVLCYQRTKGIQTNKPLVAFINNDVQKIGVIAGEGIWRWRMFDYSTNNNHELFDRLVNKTIQYLALQINKERFVVKTKNLFNENEPVDIVAEVYNKSFELITKAEVKIDIFNADDKRFAYGLAADNINKSFHLTAGTFPVGDYRYTATAEADGETFVKSGQFSVMPLDLEALNTMADHQLLYQLANKYQGQLFYPKQLDDLLDAIKENENIVPVSYTDKKLRDVIALKWVFFLLLGLLTTEWFFRKFFGHY